MEIHISQFSGVPIYQQIVDQIKHAILSGRLKSGEALPSMRLLARELRISVITTKRAYEELERLGMIQSATGRGSFVSTGSRGAQTLREAHWVEARAHLAAAVKEARAGDIETERLMDELKGMCEGDGWRNDT